MSDLSADLVEYQTKDPDQALDDAVAVVRAHCGWHIAPSQAATAVAWSSAGNSVWVPTMNLTAVTSVTQNAAVVDSSTYTFVPHGVISRTYGAYFSTLTPITVVFTHGYADWPDDVKGVILSLAQRSISDTRGLVVTATGTTAGARETYGPQLTKADEAKLALYVIPPPLGA